MPRRIAPNLQQPFIEEALQRLLLEQQLSGGGGIDLPELGAGSGGQAEDIIPMGDEPISVDFQMPDALPWESAGAMPQINAPDATGGDEQLPFADLSGVVPNSQMPDFGGPGFAQDVPGGSDFFDSIVNPPPTGFEVAPTDDNFTGTPVPSWAEPTPIPFSGGEDPGSLSPFYGNPMSFDTQATPDWESLPSSDQSLWTMPDYFSGGGGDVGVPNVGGSDIADFGGDLNMGGYVPPSTDVFLGMAGTDVSSPGVDMPQDLSQTPGDVFGGLEDPVPAFSEPDSLNAPPQDIPIPDGFGDLVAPPPIPDVPPDQPAPDAGLHDPSSDPNATPAADNPDPAYMPAYVIPGNPYSGKVTMGLGVSESLGLQTGGFMPVGGGVDPPKPGLWPIISESAGTRGDLHALKFGEETGPAPQAVAPVQPDQYISGYRWVHNPMSSYGTGFPGAGGAVHGYWEPIFTPGTGTNAPAPPPGAGKTWTPGAPPVTGGKK